MKVSAFLTIDPIDSSLLLQRFISGCEEEGAIVSFSGLARATASDGSSVTTLRLEAHPRLTQLSLHQIAHQASERFDVSKILVLHRYGSIAPRETIVFVATASLHRRAAFLAADYLMDKLKTEAVFWKKEEGIHEGRWIEPTEEDRAALAQWA